MRSAVILTILACCALPASAQASNLVFVCGEDLCSARGDGSNRVRQTRDGRADRFSSPTVSRSGKRMAFTRGERGRVYTARLARRTGPSHGCAACVASRRSVRVRFPSLALKRWLRVDLPTRALARATV